MALLKIASLTHKRPKAVYRRIKKKAFNSWFIRILSEMYITIVFACLIKMYAIDFSNWYESFCSTYAIAVLLVTMTFPIIASIFLLKKHKEDWSIMNQ